MLVPGGDIRVRSKGLRSHVTDQRDADLEGVVQEGVVQDHCRVRVRVRVVGQ